MSDIIIFILAVAIANLLLYMYLESEDKKKQRLEAGLGLENFCAIQYPVCDHYCQQAKLDLCVAYAKDGIKVPSCQDYYR